MFFAKDTVFSVGGEGAEDVSLFSSDVSFSQEDYKKENCTALAEDNLKQDLEEGTVAEFLDKRGLGKMEDMNAKSLEDRYFKGTNRKSCPCYGIVYATVKPRE